MKVILVALSLVVAALAAPGTHTYRPGFIGGLVVGGHEANRGEFPYQISLQYGYSFLLTHICGGSILNENWIMTAGHCITDALHLPLAHYYAVAGIHSLKEKGQIIKVVSTHVHPQYQGGVNPNDIALLRLEKALVFGDIVQPVNLPKPESVPTGTSILSGWGSTSTSVIPKMPTKLQTIDLPIVSYEDCKDALIALNGQSEPLAESNICTGPFDIAGKGACSGDSGGPLVVRDEQGTTVIGVVSWGMLPCGSKGAPSVYTRVSAFMDFITETIKN